MAGYQSEGLIIPMKNGEASATIYKGMVVYTSANDTVKIVPSTDSGEWNKICGVATSQSPFVPSVQGTYTNVGYLPNKMVAVQVSGITDIIIENSASVTAASYVTPSDSAAGRCENWVEADVGGSPSQTTINAAIKKQHYRIGKCLKGGTGNSAGTVYAKVLMGVF